MLLLLSPAKSLDFETPLPPAALQACAALEPGQSTPHFNAQAARLIELLRPRPAADIAALMDLSDALAQLNVARYRSWSRRATARNSRPALLAFDGDVYAGLDARTLSADDLAWAQKHLRILSGLYGALRPLDKLQPYRLEMGTVLPNEHGRDLYAYWGDRVARHLERLLADEPEPVIVNLASQEYFRVVGRRLKSPVIDCVFEEWHGGQWKIIGFHAKRARGAMARYAMLNRLREPGALTGFSEEGYAFDRSASTDDRWVFRRAASSAEFPAASPTA